MHPYNLPFIICIKDNKQQAQQVSEMMVQGQSNQQKRKDYKIRSFEAYVQTVVLTSRLQKWRGT